MIVELGTKKKNILLLSSVVLLAFIGIYLLIINQQTKSELAKGFPILLPGAYAGSLEYDSAGEKKSGSLYVERLREGNTLLFVLFIEGFQPQTVFPQKLINEGQTERLRPISLNWKDEKLVLSGKEDGGFYRGLVRSAGKNSGEWTIRRMTPDEVNSVSLGEEEEKILLWLRSKERLRKNSLDKNLLEQEQFSISQRVSILEEALGDKLLLQSRSEDRRKELEKQLTSLREERDRSASELDSLVNTLDLQTRITKRGQAVSLERKILQREIRWYNVHWQGEEETQDISEEESGIDLAKLENAVRKARETKSFIREREEEIQKIRELTDALNNPESPSTEPSDTPSNEEKPLEEKNKLWDRLFG